MTHDDPPNDGDTSPDILAGTPVLGYDPGDFRAAVAYAVNRGKLQIDARVRPAQAIPKNCDANDEVDYGAPI